ncbi:MAG TPA: nucleotidyltransferase domain-containing protein [Bacteroidales bacterium]|nr:nucleotidyltransferase domain-containing protein [Bacteroidales bacterium]
MVVASKFNTKELQKLCQKFKVKELYLFGSAASGNLTPDSDLDFIVNFERDGYAGAFDQFIDFKQQLEKIYGRPVDLYHQKKFRNAIFQRDVDQSKQLLYAA